MESTRHFNFSALFDRLLRNPELISGVLSLVGGLLSSPSPPQATPPQATPTQVILTGENSPPETPPSVSEKVEGELSSPSESVGGNTAEENALSFLSGLQSGASNAITSDAEAASGNPGESIPVMSPAKTNRPHKRRDILCAVKPYMNRRRCDMIDRMLHAADLVELIRHA